MNNAMKSLLRGLLGIVVVLVLSTLTQCTETTADSPESRQNLAGGLSDLVVATVGDTNITAADIMSNLDTYQLVHNKLLTENFIAKKAELSGITFTDDELRAKMDGELAANGTSYDEYLEQSYPDIVPMRLRIRHFQNQFKINSFYEELMKIQYIEEVGMPTEEQIADKYENETWIKDQMGMQLGIPSDQVTMEQAHDLIITAFVREWQGFDFESLLEQWKTDIGFEVYLNEINGVNELESIEVPEIPAAEDEHREAEMEEAPEGSEGH